MCSRWRSVTNSEAERKTLRYQGVTMRPSVWELNPGYEQIAVALVRAVLAPGARGRYLAVQWRSEDWQANARKPRESDNATHSMVQCARWAAAPCRTVSADLSPHRQPISAKAPCRTVCTSLDLASHGAGFQLMHTIASSP